MTAAILRDWAEIVVVGSTVGLAASYGKQGIAYLGRHRRKHHAHPIARVFVGTCGHSIPITADLPPSVTCPACGRQYVQLLQLIAEPPALPDVFTPAQVQAWSAAFKKADEALKASQPSVAQKNGRLAGPPVEVFPTVGPESSEDVGRIESAPWVEVPDLAGADIIDVSDEIDTPDIEEA